MLSMETHESGRAVSQQIGLKLIAILMSFAIAMTAPSAAGQPT